jgi:hypothetical protein
MSQCTCIDCLSLCRRGERYKYRARERGLCGLCGRLGPCADLSDGESADFLVSLSDAGVAIYHPGESSTCYPKGSRRQRVWDALPGTSELLASKSGVQRREVQRILRAWLAQGKVTRRTSWMTQQSYTWVYSRAEGGECA